MSSLAKLLEKPVTSDIDLSIEAGGETVPVKIQITHRRLTKDELRAERESAVADDETFVRKYLVSFDRVTVDGAVDKEATFDDIAAHPSMVAAVARAIVMRSYKEREKN